MKVEIYSIPNCPACSKAKMMAENHNSVHEVVYNTMGKEFQPADVRELFPQARTFPQIFVDGELIGGYLELEKVLNG
jgi:glutaredoxin